MKSLSPAHRATSVLQRTAVAFAITASLGQPAVSHAIIPVIDAAHIAVSSYTSVQQYLNTAQAYISAYNDVLQTARNLTAFDGASVFLESEEKTALMNFIKTGRSVQGALRKTEDVYADFQAAFAVSKHTNFEDFLKDFGRRKAHGDKLAKTLYDAATLAEDELMKAHEQHMLIVNEIPLIEGVTDAALATAQSVGVLIQQTQGMTQMIATSTRLQGLELQRRYDDRAKQEEAMKNILETQNEAVNKDKALLDQ